MNAATDPQAWGIRLENVSVAVRGLDILDAVTADIEPGSITAVIGPNGAGKTTLLLALLDQIHYRGNIRFIPPGPSANSDSSTPSTLSTGSTSSTGSTPSSQSTPSAPSAPSAPSPSSTGSTRSTGSTSSASPRPTIGYVPQRLDFDRGIPLSVRDFLVGSVQRRPLWFAPRNGMRERVDAVLERVGMQQFEKRKLGELSGGELQRILLAQALLQEPKILLLDEPSSAVDVAGESLFCDLLQSVHQRRHLTTIWVSHDLSVVSSHADRVLCLNKTIACAGTPESTLTTERIQELFGPHSTVYGHHDHAHHEHEPH